MAGVLAGYFIFFYWNLCMPCARGKRKKKKVIGLGFMSLCVAFCFCQLVTSKEKTGSQMVAKCMLNSWGVQVSWHWS